MENRFDVLLGDILTLPEIGGVSAIYVRKLDFIIAMVGEGRVTDLIAQWEISDQHYDYAVCEGGSELILFANEEDLIKFKFFTCLCPITRTYRIVTNKDRENYNIQD